MYDWKRSFLHFLARNFFCTDHLKMELPESKFLTPSPARYIHPLKILASSQTKGFFKNFPQKNYSVRGERPFKPSRKYHLKMPNSRRSPKHSGVLTPNKLLKHQILHFRRKKFRRLKKESLKAEKNATSKWTSSPDEAFVLEIERSSGSSSSSSWSLPRFSS